MQPTTRSNLKLLLGVGVYFLIMVLVDVAVTDPSFRSHQAAQMAQSSHEATQLVNALSGSEPVKAAPAMPADGPALTETLAKAGKDTGEGAIDYDSFHYPVQGGVKSAEGYPIYLIECNDDTCVGAQGQDLGSRANVAKDLSPIRNSDVLNPAFHCDYVCTDPKGEVVGAVSATMEAYLAQVKRSNH